jgi:Zn-dependent peptidase ImmA (M78 family)
MSNINQFYQNELKELESNTEHIIITKTGDLLAPIDIRTIIENYGISVSYFTESESTQSNIRAKIDITKINSNLYINKNFNEKAQRFLLAHELGHYYAYHKQGLTGTVTEYHNGTEDTIEERFANQFAISILIPINLLHPMLKLTHNVYAIADIFNIHYEFVKFRLTSIYKNFDINENGNIVNNYKGTTNG